MGRGERRGGGVVGTIPGCSQNKSCVCCILLALFKHLAEVVGRLKLGGGGGGVVMIMVIMYIYHVLINALSAHMMHINLNMIFHTHVEHSPTKTIYIKYYKK